MTRLERRKLALLYVLRWANYSRARRPDGLSGSKEAKARALRLAREGLNPIPPDQEPVSLGHLIVAEIGHLPGADPTGQEAWLTVEIVGNGKRFVRWAYLEGHSAKPWPWWRSVDGPCRLECFGLLVLLSQVLDLDPDSTAGR